MGLGDFGVKGFCFSYGIGRKIVVWSWYPSADSRDNGSIAFFDEEFTAGLAISGVWTLV